MDDDLRTHLDRWRTVGLITSDQERAIEEFENTGRAPSAMPAPVVGTAVGSGPAASVSGPVSPAPSRRVPAVAEALGYLGGILAIVGLVLFVARLWNDLAVGVRLGLTVGAAVALFVAGLAVPERREEALARLRGFVWLLSSAATAVAAVVFVVDVMSFENRYDGSVEAIVAAITAAHSALLWRGRARPFQYLSTLGATAVALGAGLGWAGSSVAASLAVWALGVLAVVGALRRVVAFPVIAGLAGAIVTMAGTVVGIANTPSLGLPLAAGSAIALVWLGVESRFVQTRPERRAYTVFGVAMVVQSVPQVIVFYADRGGIATGAVVSVVGLALVMIAVRRLSRMPIPLLVVGGLAAVGGAAVIGAQSVTVATIWGLVVAVSMVVASMWPGRSALAVFGSLGLLVNVPWAIAHFFPGGGRAPLLILASGAVLIAAAVLITRMGGRIRREWRPRPSGPVV